MYLEQELKDAQAAVDAAKDMVDGFVSPDTLREQLGALVPAAQLDALVDAACGGYDSAKAKLERAQYELDVLKAAAKAAGELVPLLEGSVKRVIISAHGVTMMAGVNTGNRKPGRSKGAWIVNERRFRTARELCESYPPLPEEKTTWTDGETGEVKVSWSVVARRVMRRLKREHPNWIVGREADLKELDS